MGFSIFFSWNGLRFSCGAWFKRLIISVFLIQFIYIQTAQAFAPLVAGGEIVLTRVLGNVVARRAIASVAANDALIGVRTIQTYRALGTVAANDARFALGATSTLRHAKDISWVGLALASGAITLSDLNVTGNDELNVVFEPTAVKLTDGRYGIRVNGEMKVVNAQPSAYSPAIYTYSSKVSKPISDTEVYLADEISNQYKYYGGLYNGSYAQSNSLEKLAEYLTQEKYGGKNEENYRDVEINGTSHRYLGSKTEVTNTYLRHKKIGDSIYFTVRQHFTYHNLKSSFQDETSGVTAEGQWVSSFNKPSEEDYEITKNVRSIDSSFKENENFIGNIKVKPQEQQLGSIEDIDSGLLYSAKPLTAQQLATIYNALLLSASSQVGYAGVPFTSANPITANEVAQSLAELGLENPSYADLFTKAGVGNQIKIELATAPQTNPSISPNLSPNNSEEIEDIGDIEDAELTTPELEPPTARQILEPFNKFFPTLKNLTIAERSVQCPIWEGHLPYLDIDIRLDKHCDYLEQNKGVISSLMLLIWGIIALRILLSA